MLKNGTIDAWAYNDMAGIWLIQQSGENASDYKVAYVLGPDDGYYAFNKETPDSLVQSFQQALDYIKSNKDSSGVSDYEKILTKYIPMMYIASITKQNEVIAFLNEAVTYLKENGKEKALQEFNNRSGSFVRGDLYIFAYDFNGTYIAHPINPDLIGRTRPIGLQWRRYCQTSSLHWPREAVGPCILCSQIQPTEAKMS